jgi:hypothetical protein
MNSEDKEERLLRDSRWMREYKVGSNLLRSESKFRSEALQVSADSIIGQWSSFGLDEQIEFSNAYRRKPSVTSEDERILNFLMAVGPRQVWVNLALFLCRHPDRESVFRFLVARIQEEEDHCANYFSAIEKLNDSRAIPILERRYNAFRTGEAYSKRTPLNQSEISQLFDYLYCCRALLSLDGSPKYEAAIKEWLNHSDAIISTTAQRLLTQSATGGPESGNDHS